LPSATLDNAAKRLAREPVSGDVRHVGPAVAQRMGADAEVGASFFDGPLFVSWLAFSLREGKLLESVDVFDHPYWDHT